MEVILALVIGLLFGCGFYLLLRRSLIQVLFGLGLLTNAVNLLIFVSARLTRGEPPFVEGGQSGLVAPYADPLPQALILTAIVITFGVTAFLLALAYRSWALTHDDEVQDDVEDRLIARTIEAEIARAAIAAAREREDLTEFGPEDLGKSDGHGDDPREHEGDAP